MGDSTDARLGTEGAVDVPSTAVLLGKIGRLPVETQRLISDYIDSLRFMRGTETLRRDVHQLRRRIDRLEILVRSSLVGPVGRAEVLGEEARP